MLLMLINLMIPQAERGFLAWRLEAGHPTHICCTEAGGFSVMSHTAPGTCHQLMPIPTRGQAAVSHSQASGGFMSA